MTKLTKQAHLTTFQSQGTMDIELGKRLFPIMSFKNS